MYYNKIVAAMSTKEICHDQIERKRWITIKETFSYVICQNKKPPHTHKADKRQTSNTEYNDKNVVIEYSWKFGKI